MFTSSQQLADAQVNGKIFAVLAMLGAMAGAALGPVVHFKSLPPAAQQLVTPVYVANFNLARIPVFANQRWLETRISAYKNAPQIAQTIDGFPTSVAVGAGVGAIGLPLTLGMLIAGVRRNKIPKQKDSKKKSVADFLPRG